MKKCRPRKPRDLFIRRQEIAYTCLVADENLKPTKAVAGDAFEITDPKDARRLAAWLLRAAEYLERKKK